MNNKSLTVGEKIKNLRLMCRKSQLEIAKALSVSRTCLSNYELDVRVPDVTMLKALAEYFNIDVSYFLDNRKVCAVLNEADKHTVYLTTEKQPPQKPKKLSHSSQLALNYCQTKTKYSNKNGGRYE